MTGLVALFAFASFRADFSAVDALAEARKFQQQRFTNIKSREEFDKAQSELRAKVTELLKGVKVADVPPADCLPLSQVFQMGQQFENALTSVERFLTTADANEQHMGKMLAVRFSAASQNVEKLLAHTSTVPLGNSKQALSFGQSWLQAPFDLLVTKQGLDQAYEESKKVKMRVLEVKSLTEADKNIFIASYGSTLAEYLAEKDKKKEALAEIDAALSVATEKDKASLSSMRSRITLVGSPAPELKFSKGYGNFKPSEMKGKVVMLDFFAHWCGPCIASFPDLKELVKELKPKGLELVGITRYYGYFGKEREITPEVEFAKMEGFIKEQGMTWPVMYGERDNFTNFGCSGIPHVVLIDKKGVVRKIKVGYSSDPVAKASFKTEVESLLAEKA